MNNRNTLLCFLSALAYVMSLSAHGRDMDLHTVNMATLDNFLRPAYTDLADSAVMLNDSANSFCRGPDQAGLEAVRRAFHDVMDRWQVVQHVSIGPATFEMRRYRMQLWPDKRGNVGKHLGRLLESGDAAQLAPDTFAPGNVAVQGLSALEQLLFEDDVDVALFSVDQSGQFRCLVTTTITSNIDNITRRIVSDWVQGSVPHSMYFDSATYGNAFYDSDEDLATRLLRDLRMQLQFVLEYKLLRVIGEDVQSSRYRRAESWRSQRSIRNVRINIESIRRQWQAGFAAVIDTPRLVDEVETAFDRVLAILDTLDRPLRELVEEPNARASLAELVNTVATLTEYFLSHVPTDLELNVGTVSLDGD